MRYRHLTEPEPGPNDPADARFPFAADRVHMRAFLHGQPLGSQGDGATVVSLNWIVPDLPGPALGIMFGLDDTPRTHQTIAHYDDDGGLVFALGSNPNAVAHTVRAWNWLLETLGEPDTRRVVEDWSESDTVHRRGKPVLWPVRRVVLDGQALAEGQPVVACGRLTLAAWRAANP